MVVATGIRELSPSFPVLTRHDHRPATTAARRHPGQEVLRGDPAWRPAPSLVTGAAQVRRSGCAEAGVSGFPELIRNDAQLRGGYPDPLGLRALRVALHAPLIPLPEPVPYDLAPVERAMEDLAHARRRPRARPPAAPGCGRERPFRVQRLRDALDAQAGRAEFEDPPDDRRFPEFDNPLYMHPMALAAAVRRL